MITCDEDLAGQIYVGREELKVRLIGHCAMLEEDAMHIGTEADVSAHVLDTNGKRTQLRGLLDTGAVLSVIPSETWERMGFNRDNLIDSRIRLSAANKGALRVLSRTPTNNSPKLGGMQPVDELSCAGKPRRVRPFHFRQRFRLKFRRNN